MQAGRHADRRQDPPEVAFATTASVMTPNSRWSSMVCRYRVLWNDRHQQQVLYTKCASHSLVGYLFWQPVKKQKQFNSIKHYHVLLKRFIAIFLIPLSSRVLYTLQWLKVIVFLKLTNKMIEENIVLLDPGMICMHNILTRASLIFVFQGPSGIRKSGYRFREMALWRQEWRNIFFPLIDVILIVSEHLIGPLEESKVWCFPLKTAMFNY